LLEALPEMVDPDGRAENGFGEHAVGNDPAADIPPGRQQVTLRLVLLRAVRVRTHDGNRAATVALDRRIRYPAIDDIHPRLGEGAVERPLEPPPGNRRRHRQCLARRNACPGLEPLADLCGT